MGQNFKNFEVGGSSGIINTIFLVLFLLLVIYILYKVYLYYLDRRKWSWFLMLCKEKRLTPKEVNYLKNLVMRNKIKNIDALFGSIYQMNLPSPIKRKLLFDQGPGR